MDIHKPKPWHGWREFLKEYLIIVVGVLTALAAEQGVESLRVRHELSELKAALDRSVRYNLAGAAERVALAPCLDARIAHLRDKLAAAGETWRADPQAFAGPTSGALSTVPEAYHTPYYPMVMAGWQAALASRDISTMPIQSRGRYSQVFTTFDWFNTAQASEHAISGDLDPLSFDLRLTPELRAHYLDRLAALARLEALAVSNGRQVLATARSFGWVAERNQLAEMIADQRRFRGGCVQDVVP